MTDIFAVLEQDHLAVKEILDRLEEDATPETRADLAERLVIEESKHEAAEEQYFWPAVRERVPDGDAIADKAIEQETEGKHVLDQLRKAEPGSAEFDSLIATFIAAGRKHIAYEEEAAWPKLRAVLSSEQADKLGEAFAAAKQLGPTRPHPHTPSNPGVLKTAGTAAAMADRAIDAVTGRGD